MPPSNETETDGLAVAVVLTLELAKIARVLVRLDHVARFIVDPNHGVMRAAIELCVVNCVADCVWVTVPQATEWQRIGNEIGATFVASFGELMNTSHHTLFYVSK